MEMSRWQDFDDEDEDAGLVVEDLLRDAPDGCFYCRLAVLAEGDDD
jgi:hypothetical protein